MNSVSLAGAKAHLSELVAQAESGEDICITRRGKPVARLTAATSARQPIRLADLQALTGTQPPQAEPAEEFMRRMRDESRF